MMDHKTLHSRRKILKYSAVSAVLMTSFSTRAAEWPEKVVRMVVAFPAGGPTDTVARLIAQKLSARLGQQVLVENKPGASGSIGTDFLIKAPADGYTISLLGMPAILAPIIYRNSLYDPRKDFTCVSTVYDVAYVMVINPEKLPGVENLSQLIAAAKSKDINYSSPSTGSIGHLSIEQLKDLGGFKMNHIPYKGSAPAMTDLLGGQISMMFVDLISAMPHIQAGKLKAVALGTPETKIFLPTVKSVSEQGFPGFESSSWSGVIVPNGTPAAVITRLDKELKIILNEQDTKDRIEKIGALAVYQPAEKMKSRLVAEYSRWVKVATEKNISAQ